MSGAQLRWGILAPGRIAEGFVRDLHASGVGRAVACGSRSLERAQAFAARFGVDRAWGSYEQLLNDPGVDIVYVASPHNHHAQHTLAALEAGKPVLCEKPLALNLAQASSMFAKAREKKLFLMEALWSYFLPAQQQAMTWLTEGRIGELQTLQATFGFSAAFSPSDRLFDPRLAGGATLDVGVYPLSMAQRFLGNAPPRVRTTARIGTTGVDETTLVGLSYPNGTLADLACSLRHDMDNTASLYGPLGAIRLPRFWRTEGARLETASGVEVRDFPRSTGGYEFEARAVTEAVLQGQTEHPVLSQEFSLRLAATLDEVRSQIGLVYPDEAPGAVLMDASQR